MRYDQRFHLRRAIRRKGYDYSSPGAYFVTLVTMDRLNLFGEVVGDMMKLSLCGEIAQKVWGQLPHRFLNITLDFSVIMPNHFHGIIVINEAIGRGGSSASHQAADKFDLVDQSVTDNLLKTRPYNGQVSRPYKGKRYALSELIRSLKSDSARRINNIRGTTGCAVWQRNYYERIVRNQRELDALRAYIIDNPRHWMEDKEYKV
ncbi:MAG: transposase [Anaerolineae bacterium]|nr:transposase [Anaerolineae bacterium]